MNKTAIVTGTSSGIGNQAARNLLGKGYTVYGGSRSESTIEHPHFLDVELDVRSEESVINFFDEIEKETEQIDLFINNAGICEFLAFEETSSVSFQNHFQTNTLGAFYMYKYLEPFLIEDETRIINILSLSSKESFPGIIAYSSAESAKKALIESIKQEWSSYKVSINNLFLGAVDTKLWDDFDDLDKSAMLSLADFNYLFSSLVDCPSHILISDITASHKLNIH